MIVQRAGLVVFVRRCLFTVALWLVDDGHASTESCLTSAVVHTPYVDGADDHVCCSDVSLFALCES